MHVQLYLLFLEYIPTYLHQNNFFPASYSFCSAYIFFKLLDNHLYLCRLFWPFVPKEVLLKCIFFFFLKKRHLSLELFNNMNISLFYNILFMSEQIDLVMLSWMHENYHQRDDNPKQKTSSAVSIFKKNSNTKSEDHSQFFQKNSDIRVTQKELWSILLVEIAVDSILKNIHIRFLQKTEEGVKAAETTTSFKPLKGKKSATKQQERRLCQGIFSSLTKIPLINTYEWGNKLKINHESIKQVSMNTIIVKKTHREQFSENFEKIELFKHIFLTEVITHMIINRFKKNKKKRYKYRDGRYQLQYQDEDLQELRSFGYRFSEFKDHSFKSKYKMSQLRKKKLKSAEKNQEDEESDDNYQDDDEYEDDDDDDILLSDSSDQGEEQKKTKKKFQGAKKKTKLSKMKEKIKNKEGICNFTFITGKEKSQVNRIRYSLYQMTRETDKTQALIDFLRLVFKVYSKQELVGCRVGEAHKQKKMAHFMKQFKVRRNIKNCFEQYTKESFFHKILNTGLRVLKHPYELAYLRLPFSHIFWSIKSIYHRHRQVMLRKQEENLSSKKCLSLYRGFQICQKQIKKLRKSIGKYIEIQGILSTTLDQTMADSFMINAKMIIEAPVLNLGGMFDNGFARISFYSLHQRQREVVINAFNLFKIVSVTSNLENDRRDQEKQIIVYQINLQYGGLKLIEQKVQSSDALLDSEYMLRVNMGQRFQAKMSFEMNKKNLTAETVQKLEMLLLKGEKQLEKRMDQLDVWKDNEYNESLNKLRTWEKQLIINAKHQKNSLALQAPQNIYTLIAERNCIKKIGIEPIHQKQQQKNCLLRMIIADGISLVSFNNNIQPERFYTRVIYFWEDQKVVNFMRRNSWRYINPPMFHNTIKSIFKCQLVYFRFVIKLLARQKNKKKSIFNNQVVSLSNIIFPIHYIL